VICVSATAFGSFLTRSIVTFCARGKSISRWPSFFRTMITSSSVRPPVRHSI
jgi:hypothetical protein